MVASQRILQNCEPFENDKVSAVQHLIHATPKFSRLFFVTCLKVFSWRGICYDVHLDLHNSCNYWCVTSLLTLSLLVATFVISWSPFQTVWTQIMTVKMSVLIWIQTVWLSDSVLKQLILNKNVSSDNNKSVKNYPACKELNVSFCSRFHFQCLLI